MVSSQSVRRSAVPAGTCVLLALLLPFIAVANSPAHAADYTVVQGIVQRVSGNYVAVSGHDYNVAAARVVSPSATELPRSEVAPGRKVSLLVTRRGVSTVVVYPTHMVE